MYLFDDELKSLLSKDALNVKREATNSSIKAIFIYSTMFDKGIGVPTNSREALKMSLKS